MIIDTTKKLLVPKIKKILERRSKEDTEVIEVIEAKMISN